jgi:hypothetical protein
MKSFFLEEKTFACHLQDKDLADVFSQWKSDEFQVKKQINNNNIIVRRKYAAKAYGDVLINFSFNKEKQLATLKVTPIPIAYILFTIIPLSYIVLFAGKSTNYLHFLSPLILFLFFLFTFKWNLISSKQHFLAELKFLLKKKGIQFNEK